MSTRPSSRLTRAAAAVVVVGTLTLGGVSGMAGAATNVAVPGARVAGSSSVVASSRPASVAAQVVGKCDNVGSKHFAKTRFLFHSALGFGAFHRYIYKPLKAGSFASGASGRVKAFLKAALAGVFVVHEVKQMVTFAEADKTLCKIVPSIAGIQTAISDLIAKFKGRNASEVDVSQVSDQLESVKTQANDLGASISDRNVSVPGL